MNEADSPIIDPETGKRIDFYKILGLDGWPGDGEAKKAYYKAAMKLHPDKNRNNPERAEIVFKYLQEAWKTLSDPSERAYYDRNRVLILSGGAEEDEFYGVDTFVNLASYRSTSCYTTLDDSPKGFYTVYAAMFRALADEEVRAATRRVDIKSYAENELSMLQRRCQEAAYPPFGASDASESIVFTFYEYWTKFTSIKEFMHENYYSSDGNSRYRRLAEGENKKFRDEARFKFSSRVRDLAMYLKRRDPRIDNYMEERRRQNAEAEQRREEKIQQSKREKQANRQALKEELSRKIALLTEKVSNGTISSQEMLELESLTSTQQLQADKIADELAGFKSGTSGPSGKASISKNQQTQITLTKEYVSQGLAFDRVTGKLYCKICNQRFQMEGEFKSHLTSKKHRNAQKEAEPPKATPTQVQAVENVEGQEDKREQRKRRRAARNNRVDDTNGANEDQEKSEDNATENNKRGTVASAGGNGSGETHSCKICKQKFSSRTQLFKHIKETGHAALKHQ